MITKWQIFLFDFDGTLVNSEAIHHQAYLQVAKEYGIPFNPDFAAYACMAHFSDHALRDAIEALAPMVDWKQFYGAKKRAYLEILDREEPTLMEGVASLLEQLSESAALSCVVTHSAKEQTERYCEKIPLLRTINHWITREDYDQPKPAHDSYRAALAKLNRSPDQKVVGFEDSVRGLQALFGIDADRFLVSQLVTKEAVDTLRQNTTHLFTHIRSIKDLH